MSPRRIRAGVDTIRAAWYLLSLHALFRLRGRRWVARATREAMQPCPASQSPSPLAPVDPWRTAAAVWRAKAHLPFDSTCLETALATQMLFQSKGVPAVVRVGVRAAGEPAHAWVEVGGCALDDQHISGRFSAFPEPSTALPATSSGVDGRGAKP